MLCPNDLGLPCNRVVIQQRPDSNVDKACLHDGGNNTYVPTTTFYSDFVEIAQPDNGKDPISYIQDPRNVGVTNNKAKDI